MLQGWGRGRGTADVGAYAARRCAAQHCLIQQFAVSLHSQKKCGGSRFGCLQVLLNSEPLLLRRSTRCLLVTSLSKSNFFAFNTGGNLSWIGSLYSTLIALQNSALLFVHSNCHTFYTSFDFRNCFRLGVRFPIVKASFFLLGSPCVDCCNLFLNIDTSIQFILLTMFLLLLLLLVLLATSTDTVAY